MCIFSGCTKIDVLGDFTRCSRLEPRQNVFDRLRFSAVYLLQFVNILEVECCVEQSEERVHKLELKIYWMLSMNYNNDLHTYNGYFENEVSFVVRLNFVVF